MTARIYKPAKTAMSSGKARTHEWVLEFPPETARRIDPLMGWTSAGETDTQVRLRFGSLEEAQDYARQHGIKAIVIRPHERRPNIRPQGYGENFASNRRMPWTH